MVRLHRARDESVNAFSNNAELGPLKLPMTSPVQMMRPDKVVINWAGGCVRTSTWPGGKLASHPSFGTSLLFKPPVDRDDAC